MSCLPPGSREANVQCAQICLHCTEVHKVQVKEVDLYSAFIVVPHTQGAQVRITQCYLHYTVSASTS